MIVQYRLAPKYPYPTPVEDSYAALRWTFENAGKLNVVKDKIAVGGDSAGGTLAAAVCQLARDRGAEKPCFQLLVYPATDRRMETESNLKYTDTPMWNSSLSRKMWPAYLKNTNIPDIAYASPMEAESLDNLPQAYVETAEFDCLHDEGIALYNKLNELNIKCFLNDTLSTIHGYDVCFKHPIVVDSFNRRIEFLKNFL